MKIYDAPRTVWAMDFYGVYPSKEGYCEILGATDLATHEIRLFPLKARKAATLLDSIVHGIILRDGVPLAIHTDHATEFVGKAMQTLSKSFGIKQTSTLGHHPTGNAAIERVWQFVGKCLMMMTDQQHGSWQNYIRLIEHVYNTTLNRTLGFTPFEAAHGLPARSVVDCIAPNSKYSPPTGPNAPGVQAMTETAKAFRILAIQAHTRAKTEAAATANAKGKGDSNSQSFKLNDKVLFFIPPTAQQAKAAGRKTKHLPHWRAPATVTAKLSETTYEIEHKNRKYKRALAELRRYHPDQAPLHLPAANHADENYSDYELGNFVALADTDDPSDDLFHVAKIISVADGKVQLLNYATNNRNLTNAKFEKLFQNSSDGRYRRGGRESACWKQVVDEIDIEDEDEYTYVRHHRLRLTANGKLTSQSRQQLQSAGLKHHILGTTFP